MYVVHHRCTRSSSRETRRRRRASSPRTGCASEIGFSGVSPTFAAMRKKTSAKKTFVQGKCCTFVNITEPVCVRASKCQDRSAGADATSSSNVPFNSHVSRDVQSECVLNWAGVTGLPSSCLVSLHSSSGCQALLALAKGIQCKQAQRCACAALLRQDTDTTRSRYGYHAICLTRFLAHTPYLVEETKCVHT